MEAQVVTAIVLGLHARKCGTAGVVCQMTAEMRCDRAVCWPCGYGVANLRSEGEAAAKERVAEGR